MNIFCEHEIPENHFALVLLPATDVAFVVKFTRHWAAEIGMLASRARLDDGAGDGAAAEHRRLVARERNRDQW